MTIKADTWIRRMAREHQIIEPFVDEQMREGVISYGVSSYGYDIRVADEFKVFTNVYNTVVDPKNFDPKSFVDIKADVCMKTIGSICPTVARWSCNWGPLKPAICTSSRTQAGSSAVGFFRNSCADSYSDTL